MPLGGVFKLARNSIRSRSSVLDSFGRQVGGHGRGPSLALLDRVLGHDERLSFGGDEPDVLVVLAAEDAGDDLAVAGRQDDRFEPLCDLFVGVEDRLQQIGAILSGADAGKLGADLAAGDLAGRALTLWQRRHSTAALDREDRHAALGVAAGQDFTVRGQGVALGLGLFVLLKLAAELGVVAFGGGLDQVELELGGNLAGDQPVEPA